MERTIQSIMPEAYRNGWLINLRVKKWGGTAKAQDDRFGDDFPKEIFKAMQDLLDEEGREQLNSLNTIKNSCNAVLNSNTIQFPIHGFRFLKENEEKTRLITISEAVERHKKEFFKIAEEFCNKFEALKKQYQKKFPKDYRPEKYPSIEYLRNSFEFSLQVFKFEEPDKELKDISPTVYKQQIEEIKKNCKEMSDGVLKVFSLALTERLNVLIEQCNGKKNISNGTLNSITNLIEKFEELYKDFIDEDKVKRLTSDMKEYLDGVDSDLLKADDDFRNLISKKAVEVVKSVKSISVMDKPKRKIDL